jgi:hypothetical protein
MIRWKLFLVLTTIVDFGCHCRIQDDGDTDQALYLDDLPQNR